MRAARVMVILAALVVAGQAAAGAYVLRPGDTLTGVAARNRVSVTDLAQANGISNPDRVLAGTSLRIPGGPATAGTPVAGAGPTSNYVVKAGDNLETLARRFGTTSKALAAANGVRNPDLVVIGTKLKLPAPGAGVPLPGRLRRDPARVALLPRFDYWARVYGLPPDLLKGLAWYESGWQNDVVSPVGAVGIGQLMPFTSDFVSNKLLNLPLDPKQADDNIRISARFLRFLLDQTGGVPGMAVAAYYQGLMPTRAGKLYDETKRYVAGVSASRGQF